MARRWLPLALSLVLIPLTVACGTLPFSVGPRQGEPADPPSEKEATRQRQAEAKARREQLRMEAVCFRERPAFQAQMAALRGAERRLARVKEEPYVPLPAPEPWDEATESRFRLEDREVDWQQHLRNQEAWRRREQDHRARWLADHQARLRQAQWQLDQRAQILRTRRADLFTGPGSIEFNPRVVVEILQCRRPSRRPMGETAPTPSPSQPSKSVTVSSHLETLQ